MATGTTPDDREFLFRLKSLIIDGGTEVLRNTFDHRLQNQPLNAFLAREKTSINRLKTQNIITEAQYSQLYPPSGQQPRSADFDSNLIICLLKNLQSLGLRQNRQLQPTDRYIEADLCRLQGILNKIANIPSAQEFNQTTFQSLSSDTEQILLRLNAALGNPERNLRQTIADCKHIPLDNTSEERVQQEIERWQEMGTPMQLVKRDDQELVHGDKEVKNGIAIVDETIYENDKNTGKVTNRVQQIKEKPSEKGNATETIHLKEFQEKLTVLYRRRHESISLSPLLEEKGPPFLAFYQTPDFASVQVQRGQSGTEEIKIPVENLSELFFEETKEIYLIGDAGLGKTSFCKRLVLAWCQAKNRITDEDNYFTDDEKRTMNTFDAVFLLTLCDSKEECSINGLIGNQIVSHLGGTFSLEDLEIILSDTKCLVILDGLDEWTHPSIPCINGFSDIPHRRATKWTILTTTRPWKLSPSSVTNSEIDQKLEISGFSKDSAHNLKRAMISHILDLTCEETVNKLIEKFNNDLRKHGISNLKRNPLMLTYLLWFWCKHRELGESLSELYTNIIEFLFLRTEQKCEKRGLELPLLTGDAQDDIPPCFVKHKMCIKYYQLLEHLSKMAFNAYISGSVENSLVFDSENEELSQKLLHFCLQSGILTKNKVQGRLTIQEMKMSFVDRTVQEFFAALHMYTNSDKSTMEAKIISQCKCVEDILERSKFFTFLSGINVNVASSISRELINVINVDSISHNYRTTTRNIFCPMYEKPLKNIQNMCISCLKESPDNNNLKVFLQDIFIDEDCREEIYYKHLQELAVQNKSYIKSVSIIMEGIPYSSTEIISDLKLIDLSNIEKVYYEGPYSDCIKTLPLHGSVKCLSLTAKLWHADKVLVGPVTLSLELYNRVSSLDNLESIRIRHFKMSHTQFVKLVKYLSTKCSLLEIVLVDVVCDDHRTACPDSLLDLSHHKRLRGLDLHNVPLSAMKINVSSLEQSRVGCLSTSGLASHYIRELRAASKLHTFICTELKSKDIDGMLKTLRLLDQTRKLCLCYISLENRKLPISEMKNIDFVGLVGVTMTAATFRGLVDSVQRLPQIVTVHTSDCEVKPSDEFKGDIEKIKTSPLFKITVFSSTKKEEFMFKTIKDT